MNLSRLVVAAFSLYVSFKLNLLVSFGFGGDNSVSPVHESVASS